MGTLCKLAQSWKLRDLNDESTLTEYLIIIEQLLRMPWDVLTPAALNEINGAFHSIFQSSSSKHGLKPSITAQVIPLLKFIQLNDPSEDYKNLLKKIIHELQQKYLSLFFSFFFHVFGTSPTTSTITGKENKLQLTGNHCLGFKRLDLMHG